MPNRASVPSIHLQASGLPATGVTALAVAAIAEAASVEVGGTLRHGAAGAIEKEAAEVVHLALDGGADQDRCG